MSLRNDSVGFWFWGYRDDLRIELQAPVISPASLKHHLNTDVTLSLNNLTLKAPRKKNASENVVCWSRLLQIIA